MTTPTLDLSGLSPAAVRQLHEMADRLRAAEDPPTDSTRMWAGETTEEWLARLKAWSESHPVRNIVIDDSRESIY